MLKIFFTLKLQQNVSLLFLVSRYVLQPMVERGGGGSDAERFKTERRRKNSFSKAAW
jgi:hypothetical protein